jgi:hypothetical protein
VRVRTGSAGIRLKITKPMTSVMKKLTTAAASLEPR